MKQTLVIPMVIIIVGIMSIRITDPIKMIEST